jgi:hypothetical protein
VVSRKFPRKPLVTQATRRSNRLQTPEGLKHIQLDKTPRKKRKAVAPALSLDQPPKPSEEISAPVPLETLQEWGLQCNVSPSEITPDALMTRNSYDNAAA